jgi:hypothetical protein
VGSTAGRSVIFKVLGDSEYHASVPEHQIEFRVSRLRFDRHELHGELTVTCGLAGARVTRMPASAPAR